MKPLSLGLGCLLAAALLAIGRAGPDFDHYLNWSRAFSRSDIFEIRGAILSPNDVPLSQWAHGTGLILALPLYLTGDRFGDGPSGIVAGWLGGMVFWWAMWRLLLRASLGNVPLTLFGMGAAFVGTHAGFYSHSHGSESVGYALAAVLALALVSTGRWRIRESLVGGAAAALLIGVRTNLAIFALPATVLLGARAVMARNLVGPKIVILALGWLIGTTLIGILEVAQVNHWMTGDYLRSAYEFGGDGFLSIDLASPQLLAVLGHPWHGLLPYHPVYAIGMAAVIYLILQPGSKSEKLGWLVLGALIVLQLHIQASWYVWWLGTGTFGQRGMSITAVLLVPALVTAIARDRSDRGIRRRIWVLLTTAGCLWSYLLLLQGETNFFTYSQLLDAQLQMLTALIRPGRVLALLAGLILPAAFVVWIIRHNRPDRPDPLSEWSAGLLSILGISYLELIVAGRSLGDAAIFGLVGFALAAVVLFLSWVVTRWFFRTTIEVGREEWTYNAVGVGLVVTFLTTTALFARLAFRTERWIATGGPPPRAMECSSSVLWDEVRESFEEYHFVTGFESQKAALETFLLRSGGADCPELALP